MESVEPMTELAYQYGPFLFAILYILVVSTRTSSSLKEVNTREPEAPDTEKNTRRLVYLGNWGFSIVLVLASIVWWWSAQKFPHVFVGTIEGLTEAEMVSSPDLYFRPIFHQPLGEAPLERDEQFLLIRDEPLSGDETFKIRYCKGGPHVDKLDLHCGVGSGGAYSIEWSDSLEQNILRLDRPPVHASILGTTVMAAEIGPRPVVALGAAADPARSINRDIVYNLQDERSSLGCKIVALDQLVGLDEDLFRKVCDTTTDKESMLQTLIDLTRHSDKELAYKAGKVLKRRDADQLLLQGVMSTDAKTRRQTGEILKRMEPAKAMAILDSASTTPSTRRHSEINALKEGLIAEKAPKAVIATASKEGDRYYVRATWSPDDSATVECLTALFNDQLRSDRTLADERVLMRDRSQRLVWWYTKQWALFIAEKIEKCGGEAEFVGY